jgi:hypothetical protein
MYSGLQWRCDSASRACADSDSAGWLRGCTPSALVATVTCLAGVCWALFVPGKWYLLSFGLLGGGAVLRLLQEHIVACSAPERMRENTAYTNLLTVSLGFVTLLYGAISDRYSLKASFVLALAILVAPARLFVFSSPAALASKHR